jgi:hypothetical protein
MKNLADEIPHRAFINAQIIQSIHDSAMFERAVSDVSTRYGIPEYQFLNPAHVVSLLYCLLVVPRQLFVAGNELYWDRNLPASSVSSYFTLTKADAKILQHSSAFLRKLRNAVAHARFEIDEDMKFVFRDGQLLHGVLQVDFEIAAARVDLMRFLSEIGSMLANTRSSLAKIQ